MLNYLFEALEQVDKEDSPNKVPNNDNSTPESREGVSEGRKVIEANGDQNIVTGYPVQNNAVIKSENPLDAVQNGTVKTGVINLSNGSVKPIITSPAQQIAIGTIPNNNNGFSANLSNDSTQVFLTPLAKTQLRNRHIIGIEEKEAHIEVRRGKESKDKRLLVDVFWEVYEPNSVDGARPLSEEPAAVFVIPKEENKVSLKLKLPTDIGSKHLRSKEKNDIALRVECYMDLSKDRYKSKPVAVTTSNKFIGLLKRKQLSEADQKQRDMFIPSGEKKSNKRRKGHSPPPQASIASNTIEITNNGLRNSTQ